MSVSNGWKSHFGENTKFGNITDLFNEYRNRSPKVVCKNGVLDGFAISQENIYAGVSY